MPHIGVESNLPEVMKVLEQHGVGYTVLPQNEIGNMSLDTLDIVIVKKQSDISKNSKDQTVIEARGIHAPEIYEKIKYLI